MINVMRYLGTPATLKSEGGGSVSEVRGAPIRKCPGVSAATLAGSLLSGQRGLELRQASICDARVANSS